MSRRCDREGVAWPRLGCERGADALFGRLWSLTLTAPGAWSGAEDAREARERDHARVMDDLRVCAALPPWWTQEMLDAARARAAEWCEVFLEHTPTGAA